MHIGLVIGYIILQIILIVLGKNTKDLYYISVSASILCILYIMFLNRSDIVSADIGGNIVGGIDRVNDAVYNKFKNFVMVSAPTDGEPRKSNLFTNTMNRVNNPFGRSVTNSVSGSVNRTNNNFRRNVRAGVRKTFNDLDLDDWVSRQNRNTAIARESEAVAAALREAARNAPSMAATPVAD